VAIIYDFFATITQLTLLGLKVQAVSGGLVGEVVPIVSYGSIAVHLPKGFPFLGVMRFTVHNFHTAPLDVNIGANGIYTDEQHYYLSFIPQP
jgi:hypothetical protein